MFSNKQTLTRKMALKKDLKIYPDLIFFSSMPTASSNSVKCLILEF